MRQIPATQTLEDAEDAVLAARAEQAIQDGEQTVTLDEIRLELVLEPYPRRAADRATTASSEDTRWSPRPPANPNWSPSNRLHRR